MAKNQDIKLFLKNLFSLTSYPVNISDNIDGLVNHTFVDQPVNMIFSKVSQLHSLVAYYDGAKIYVYNNNAIQRRVHTVTHTVGQTVVRKARQQGLVDKNNKLKLISSGSLVISGVDRFFEQIKELIQTSKKTPSVRVPEASSGFKVFYLKYAWAEDMVLYLGGRKVIIPGVATTLKQLLGLPYRPGSTTIQPVTRPGLKGRGLAAIGTEQSSVAPSPPTAYHGNVSVVADARLNAIIVRDDVASLAQYHALIEALDIRPEMVEIEATIIDVNIDRMRDLGVDWAASRGRAGDDMETQFEAGFSSMLGGFASYITGNRNRFMGQLNALQRQGALNVVSSPHILTLSNIEAVFDVNSTFFVRLEGQEEVDLFNVSAGTSLRVTPHVFNDEGETQIKLMVAIEDGRQNEQQVDDIPTVTRSTISTQALIGPDESMLIGGLTREAYTQDNKKVPALGDVPVLGNLFQSKNHGKERIERMFLISPRLTNQDEHMDSRLQSVRDQQWRQIAEGEYHDLKETNERMHQKTRKPLVSLSNMEALTEFAANYPAAAFFAGKEGRCSVKFTIDTEGKPSQIQATECSDPVFIKPSKTAVAKFEYIPQTQDGMPMKIAQQTKTFVFKIH